MADTREAFKAAVQQRSGLAAKETESGTAVMPLSPPIPYGRPPGYVCHVCQEAIPVTDMVNLVLSGMWSVQVPDLPQLIRTLHLHRGVCTEVYKHNWQRDQLLD